MTNGVVSTDDIKKQWLDSLSRPDDDVLIFDLPYLDDNSVETVEYNSQNAMVDQLGLLNPVGFLLGQANAECRKHRRCKGGQLLDIVPSSRKGGQLNESGCTVQ
ncbi:hypothetical protein DPMN_088455 [Dreissena polymorpha]|nr:hypothetical protein DPMN_088455 [Dreissena polymorpha]